MRSTSGCWVAVIVQGQRRCLAVEVGLVGEDLWREERSALQCFDRRA